MTKDEAITYFGSQEALAQAIGVKQPSVAGWGEEPPLSRQLDIELATGGKLRANLSEEMRTVLAKQAVA